MQNNVCSCRFSSLTLTPPNGVSIWTRPSGIGLCAKKRCSSTPTAALPPMSLYCRHGSFDHNDPQPLCAEFGLLLRLIRPHHPPWMKAVIHSAALERVGLINSMESVASAAHPPLQDKGLTLALEVITSSSLQLDH